MNLRDIMTKTIAIIVNELTADYTQELITSVSDYYQDKDVRLIISQVKLPVYKDTDFDYQYWSLMSMIDNDDFDAYIVLSSILCSYMTPEELAKKLKHFIGLSYPEFTNVNWEHEVAKLFG